VTSGFAWIGTKAVSGEGSCLVDNRHVAIRGDSSILVFSRCAADRRNLLPTAVFDRSSDCLPATLAPQRLYRSATVGSSSAIPGPSSALCRLTNRRPQNLASSAVSFSRAFDFFPGFCPPRLCCFSREFFPLLWRECCHACFSALAAGCLPALSAHLTHDFGNKVASHVFIL
jgi:hypothetical protein